MTLNASNATVTCLTFSADGTCLAVASYQKDPHREINGHHEIVVRYAPRTDAELW
jgi:hypothetical protein